ncbi:MAG: sugar ABC transporter substrate-binding protein [Planctomycetota bacterium]|nr:sugar ABC transporter substrate-binding protein [Planctomycetota bacterium]
MINWYKVVLFSGLILICYVIFIYDRPPKPAEGKVQVRLMIDISPDFFQKFNELIDEFEEANPDIEVVHQRRAGDYFTKVQTLMVAKICPDVLTFTGKRVNAFKLKGTLLNLMPYIRRDKFDLDDFFEVGLRDAQMTENEICYLPIEGSGTVLFYNKDAFDEIGLAYPNDDWTWEDFLKAGIALTADLNGDGRNDRVGIFVDYWWGAMMPWIWSNGGKMVNESQTECLLNRPEAVGAMQFVTDLETKYKVTAKALGGTESAGWNENFAGGRVGMMCDLAYGLKALMPVIRAGNLRWSIAMQPKGRVRRPIRYTSSGFVIWKGTKHPEEAWKLIKFLEGRKFMKEYCDTHYFIPARKSLAMSKEFLDRPDTPYDERVLVRALEEARPLDNVYALRSIEYDFSTELGKILAGVRSAQEAMDIVTQRANIELKKAADQ